MPAKSIKKQFQDLAIFSAEEKTAVSIRDGILEYLGSELGMEPAEKIFTVYRSPATIANAAQAMKGIPLTDEHVSMDGAAPDTGSSVEDAVVIDQIDEALSARLAVRNKLRVADNLLPLINDKRQLSLGYDAELIPHSRWDFEQINIVPHHLAAVQSGRCGPLCSFLDRKPPKVTDMKNKLNKAFCDAEGVVSLEQIVEIATNLPEAIRKVPIDKLQELMPAMLEVISYAKEQNVVTEEELVDEENTVVNKKELEDMTKPDEEKKEKMQDSAAFKDAVKATAKKLADESVKTYASVVNKARTFLDEQYDFAGKDANTIMKDALATEHGETEFSDSELSTAFKLLKKSSPDYSKFGDSNHAANDLDARIKSELGE
jgi:hypothetical protein